MQQSYGSRWKLENSGTIVQHCNQEGSKQFRKVIPVSVGKSPIRMFSRDKDQIEEALVSSSGRVATTIVEQWFSSIRLKRVSLWARSRQESEACRCTIWIGGLVSDFITGIHRGKHFDGALHWDRIVALSGYVSIKVVWRLSTKRVAQVPRVYYNKGRRANIHQEVWEVL